MNNIWENFLEWIETEGLIKLTSLLLVVVIGFFAIKIILRIIKRMFKKTRLDNTVGEFLLSIIKFCLYLIWAMVMVSSLGISLTGFTVIATALSLGVSLSLENLLSNLVNGFVIISGKIFKEGDYIQIEDLEGEVKGIHILYTRLNTPDNKQISIPNSQVMTKSIINYSSEELRRVDVLFTISNHENIEKAKKLIFNIIETLPYKHSFKEIFCSITTLNELGATLETRIWVKGKDYWNTKYFLIENIFNELKRNKVSLARQNIDIYLQNQIRKI